MKRRKGVTIFSALTTAFIVLAAAAFAVIMIVLAPMFAEQAEEAKIIGESFDILARSKDILGAFTTFNTADLMPNIVVFAGLGTFALITLIWLIVDLKRGRKICIFFIVLFLLATYLDLIYYFALTPLQDFITKYIEQFPVLFVLLGCGLLSGLASIFALILFIVDMATGGVEKEAKPTLLQEPPVEEVEQTVSEPVIDESEVKPEEEAPAEEAPEEAEEEESEEEEEESEEAPEEEESEEEKPSKPTKKAKKDSKKKPAKKPAKKEDEARRTQTITVVKDDGTTSTFAKAYHVSRRPELNKWQVKAAGSDKAIKLFNTQKEAIEYADQLSKNQGGAVRVHSKEGKIRKS